MIEVIVRYDERCVDLFLEALRDDIESMAGVVFEEELDRVEVTLQPWGKFDEHRSSFLVKVLIDPGDVHHDVDRLSEELHSQFFDFLDGWPSTQYGYDNSTTVWVMVPAKSAVTERWYR